MSGEAPAPGTLAYTHSPKTVSFANIDPDHPYALCFSGGGLRSTAASAVFTLCLMQAQNIAGGNGKSAYEMFHRQFGVSGGAWWLFAATHGNFSKMDATWTVEQLCQRLLAAGVIRDGDFEARTREIHAGLPGKVIDAVDGDEFCCCLPVICSCFQCCCDALNCVLCCKCSDEARYPLSQALNEAAGEGALCALAEDPLQALCDFVGPILLGKENLTAAIASWDDNSGSVTSANSRTFHEASSGTIRYHPDAWVDSITDQPGASGYYHLYMRICNNAKVIMVNPPPGLNEAGCVDLASDKKVAMKQMLGFVGSAFSFDARSIFERTGLKKIADLLPDLPYGPKPLLGKETVHQIEIGEVHGNTDFQRLKESNGLSRLRDSGVDNNLSFAACMHENVVFACDNGDSSEFGQELMIGMKRGMLTGYQLCHRSAPAGWGIYKRDDIGANARGPKFVVYILGLNDSATMNVRKAQDRVARLQQLHRLWTAEIPKMFEKVQELLAA